MALLTVRYRRALDVAFAAHAGASRKGTDIPYVSHVLAVSALVLDHGGDEDLAIAALLHDVPEDAGGEARLDEIASDFGVRVADVVRALSDSLEQDPTSKAPWWERKVRHVDHLAAAPPAVLLVAAADKVHNLESIVEDYRRIGEELWTRFNADAGRAGQLWYQRRVTTVIGQRLHDDAARPLVARLQRSEAALADLVGERVGATLVRRDAEEAERQEAAVRARLVAR